MTVSLRFPPLSVYFDNMTNKLNKSKAENPTLTCVLDFLAPALSGSSVSEAPFSRCRLVLFIGEGASSLIFCGKSKRAAKTLENPWAM